MTVTAALAAAGALAVAIAVGLVVALHLLPTGLDPTRNAVSQYGRTRFARLYQGQVIASGTAGLLLAAALLSAGVRRPLPLIAIIAYGLARAAIAWNPMDLIGEAPTPAGRNHVWLALVAFAGVAIAAMPLTDTLARTGGGVVTAVAVAVAPAVPITAVVMFGSQLSPAVRQRFGLFERLFYVAVFAWLLLATCSLAVAGVAPAG